MFVFHGFEIWAGKSCLVREEKGDRETEAPVRPAVWRVGIIATAELELHRQLADFHKLGSHEVERNGPLVVAPVVSGLRIESESGVGVGGVMGVECSFGGGFGGGADVCVGCVGCVDEHCLLPSVFLVSFALLSYLTIFCVHVIYRFCVG